MIIWGTKGRYKVLKKGIFFCPECKRKTEYAYKRASKYFTLYFIPIFSMENYGDFVECLQCGTLYKPEILSLEEPEGNNEVRKFLEIIKSEVERGVSLNDVAMFLKSEGAHDDTIRMVIAIVSNGSIKECKDCKTLFIGSLSFCSNCGGKLLLARFN